jgi:hypothetical protein
LEGACQEEAAVVEVEVEHSFLRNKLVAGGARRERIDAISEFSSPFQPPIPPI